MKKLATILALLVELFLLPNDNQSQDVLLSNGKQGYIICGVHFGYHNIKSVAWNMRCENLLKDI